MKMSKSFVAAVLCFFLFLQGCDRLSQLGEYIQKKIPRKEKALTANSLETSSQRAAAPAQPTPANVLVKVGDWSLTQEDFKERLAAIKEMVPQYDAADPEQKRLVLEELVRQQLLVADARQKGMDQEKDYLRAVEEFGRTLLVQESVRRLVQNISVSTEEARQYYEQNKEALAEATTEWHVREIIVPTETEAKGILIELLKGADFAEAARQKSKSITASEGGDLGFLSIFDFPQMEKAVRSLNAGGVSSVFQGPEGFYIVKLEDKRGGQPKDFSEVQEDIHAGLMMLKQQQAILGYLEQLQKNTPLYINEKLLQESSL